jgi:hypothetical protein
MSDVTEIDAETGEVTTRAYTAEEIENRNNMEKPEELTFEEGQLSAYISVRESALAKLQSLGLTEDEARAITGL